MASKLETEGKGPEGTLEAGSPKQVTTHSFQVNSPQNNYYNGTW